MASFTVVREVREGAGKPWLLDPESEMVTFESGLTHFHVCNQMQVEHAEWMSDNPDRRVTVSEWGTPA